MKNRLTIVFPRPFIPLFLSALLFSAAAHCQLPADWNPNAAADRVLQGLVNARINGTGRTVFNVDISRDGKTWLRKYRFETPDSFTYPTFREHDGTVYMTVTQGRHSGERIMFGKLE